MFDIGIVLKNSTTFSTEFDLTHFLLVFYYMNSRVIVDTLFVKTNGQKRILWRTFNFSIVFLGS